MQNKEKSSYLSAFMVGLSIMVIMIHNQTLALLSSKIDYTEMNDLFIRILNDGILDIAVPGFFFISGYLYFRNFSIKSYGSVLKKKVHTLLIPYILWNLIGFLYAYCVSNVPFLKQFSSMDTVELTLQTVFEALFLHKYNTVCWYILSLMGLIIISPFIEVCISKKHRAILFFLFLFAYYFFFHEHMLIRDFGTLTFILGGIMGKCKPTLVDNERMIDINTITSFVLFVGIALFRTWITGIAGNILLLLANHLLRLVQLSLLWNFIGSLVKKSNRKVNNYSFPIYVMHWYVLSIVQKLFMKLIPANNITVWLMFIGSTLTTTLLIILIVNVWERLFPRIYKCFMGGR